MVWIESMMTSRGVLPCGERCDDVLDRGLGREFDRRIGRGQAARRAAAPAPPPLRRRCRSTRWPARASAAAAWISSVDLPMPGSPPSSSTEPRTKPPPVTRSSSARPEGRRGASCGLAGQRLERERPALARRRGRAPPGGASLRRAFLDQRVPLAAGVAFALPAAVGGAAVLADEGEVRDGPWRNAARGERIATCAYGSSRDRRSVDTVSAGRGWSASRSRSCRPGLRPRRRRARRRSGSRCRRAGPRLPGRSVTSTAIRSIEMRPTMGQRLPATSTSRAGAVSVGGAGGARDSRRRSRPRRRRCRLARLAVQVAP